jgi:hypothetical protein
MDMNASFIDAAPLDAAAAAAIGDELLLPLSHALGAGPGSAALVAVLLGRPSWREAARVLGGRFGGQAARQPGKSPSTEMTGPFTLALKPSSNGSA